MWTLDSIILDDLIVKTNYEAVEYGTQPKAKEEGKESVGGLCAKTKLEQHFVGRMAL